MSVSNQSASDTASAKSGTRLFISYSSSDVDFARTLHACLAGMPWSYSVWRDEREIERDWSREIATALMHSEAVLLLWSEASAKSDWVRNEWMTARALGLPIITVLLAQAPKLPPPLENLQCVSAKTGTVDEALLTKRIAAHLGTPPAYDYTIRSSGFFVPLRPNRHFVGRGRDLAALYRLLSGDLNKVGSRKVGAYGMAGVGKTQLSIEFGWRFGFAFEGVHWINAADEADWRSAFITVARDELRLGEKSTIPPADDRAWILALASFCAEHPQVLIVMDNVVTPEHLNDPSSLLGVAPLDLGCNLLFTTRRQSDLPGVSSYALGLLDSEESLALLSSRRRPGSVEENAEAKAICQVLGNLPLALTLAAAYLGEYKDVSFALYRRELAARRLDTIDIQGLTPAALATRHTAAVRATLQGQLEALASASARQLLVLAALMREAELVPRGRLGLLAGIVQEHEYLCRPVDDATKTLVKMSLAEATENEDALRLHPLVRELMLETVADPDAARAKAAIHLSDAYKHISGWEREYATRGLAAVIEDAQLGLRWLGKSNKNLELLRDFLSAESTVLYRISHAAQPGFFLQQIANRAVSQGAKRLAKETRSLLIERKLTHFALRWRTHSASPELQRTIAEGKGWVNDVALLPAGRLLTATEGGTLSSWEIDTGRRVGALQLSGGAVKRIAVAGSENRVISTSEDGMLRVWDLAQVKEIASVRPHGEKITAMTVFGDSTHIITGGDDGMVRLWDASTLEARDAWAFEEKPDVFAVMPGDQYLLIGHFSPPTGVRRAFSNERGMLEMRDLHTGKQMWIRKVHELVVDGVSVSSDGQKVATSGRDGKVKLWNTAIWEDPVTFPAKYPNTLTWLPDRRHLAFVDDRELHILDSVTNKIARRLRGHSGVVLAIAAAGSTIVSAGADDTARIWRLDPGQPAPAFERTGHGAAVSTVLATANAAISGDTHGKLRLWSLDGGTLRGEWEGGMGMRDHAIESADGQRVYSATSDLEGGSIKVLDLAKPSEETVYSTGGRVQFLKLHPNKPLLISGDGSGATLSVWDISDQARATFVRHLKVPTRQLIYVDAAALTGEGRFLVVAASESFGGKSTVFILDLASGKTLACGTKADDQVQHLAITSRGELAAYLSTIGTLYFWEPFSGREPRVVARDLGRDGKLALSDGERQLVTAANEVCVWRIPTSERMRRLAGHPGVWHLTPTDSQEVLTASVDWMVTLWNLAEGKEIASVGLEGAARALSLSADGQTLVTGDDRGDVYAFQLVRDFETHPRFRSGSSH